MLNPYFTQRNSIPTDSTITWNTQGYSTIGMDVTGTFTSGSFVLKGSNDGVQWTTVETANSSGIVSGGIISATGHYVFNVLGFNIVKYVPSAVNGTLEFSALVTVEVASVFSSQGGDVVVDSLTITGLDDSSLYTDENGLVNGAPFGATGDILAMSGTGDTDLWDVVYNGSLFVAVGESGRVYTSPTGTDSWTLRTTPTSAILLSVAYNGTFCTAVGVGGVVITSTDGITWVSRTSGTANNLSSIAWDATNSQWVAVGSTQTVITSPDAVTWTTRTYGTSTNIRGVAVGTSIIVSVAQSGIIKTSPTGVTWTTRTSGVATELYGACWDSTNSRFVVVGASGVILTSADGVTWAAQTSGVSTFLRAVYNTASAYTVVGDGGVILGSANSTTWTAKTSGTTTNLASVTNNGTIWLAVGASGVRLTSADGNTWTALTLLVPAFEATTGTGPVLRTNGDNTQNGLKTFTTPIRESSIVSAAAIATDADGDHVAATTVGTGSILALQTSSTFLVTASGFSTTVTGTARYVQTGNAITLYLPALSGTSNDASFSLSGLPASIYPAFNQALAAVLVTDNGDTFSCVFVITSAGMIVVYKIVTNLTTGGASASNVFVTSGSKGIDSAVVSYMLT